MKSKRFYITGVLHSIFLSFPACHFRTFMKFFLPFRSFLPDPNSHIWTMH